MSVEIFIFVERYVFILLVPMTFIWQVAYAHFGDHCILNVNSIIILKGPIFPFEG